MITSLENPQIKKLIQLQNKTKVRKEQKVFVLEGRKMFEEAKNLCKENIVKVYVTENFLSEVSMNHQITLEKNSDYFEDIPVEVVKDSIFKEVSETVTPQGILAVVKQPHYTIHDILNKQEVSLLLLEDLRDPGNLGTIIRTAEGAGVTGVILSKNSVDLFNPKVIRSTMGSIFRVPFVYADNFIGMLSCLKEEKITIFAAHLAGAIWYDEADYRGRSAIMIGNEANGLSLESEKYGDVLVKIPMQGNIESLNAAVAAALLMYERYKQNR